MFDGSTLWYVSVCVCVIKCTWHGSTIAVCIYALCHGCVRMHSRFTVWHRVTKCVAVCVWMGKGGGGEWLSCLVVKCGRFVVCCQRSVVATSNLNSKPVKASCRRVGVWMDRWTSLTLYPFASWIYGANFTLDTDKCVCKQILLIYYTEAVKQQVKEKNYKLFIAQHFIICYDICKPYYCYGIFYLPHLMVGNEWN